MDPAPDDGRHLGESEGGEGALWDSLEGALWRRRDGARSPRGVAGASASTRSWRAAHDASILVDAATDSYGFFVGAGAGADLAGAGLAADPSAGFADGTDTVVLKTFRTSSVMSTESSANTRPD